jgi:hypothetical protein
MIEVYGYSIATIPVIVALVYGIIELLKPLVFNGKEKLTRLIPLFAGAIGGALSIVVYFAIPELIPTSEWYSALIMGVASGLSSVGVNQIAKQAKKEDNSNGS